MTTHVQSWLQLVQYLLQRLSYWLIAGLAAFLVLACGLAFAGVWPWPDLQVNFGGQPVENAGMWAQIGVTGLALILAFYLPTNRRIQRLEDSHRSFRMGVEDVARAYHHAHAADRSSTFQLSSEFDSMRERLEYLRDHPDLSGMEPEILETAAAMSYISRDLAQTYSRENVERARGFLQQRQQEVERFNQRLDEAKALHSELKHWLTQVELEESVAAAQLERLRDELFVVLPEIGPETGSETIGAPRRVIDLPRAAE
ncbi:DNA repair protein [Rhodalgimonas zhirmunskyi]|uniref:DNA repair protein n=1 Tax=Rhodalgimonas zhirmunskyi TaxID=2964767 RepID=A0AAJ1UA87_9RHOB|nr:DNA repair protein [Rhodoalgimonas zhirmunskyi]MDQ2092612.1 DNA repair protein [Rhodoalgimonas zhirmunskyi]